MQNDDMQADYKTELQEALTHILNSSIPSISSVHVKACVTKIMQKFDALLNSSASDPMDPDEARALIEAMGVEGLPGGD